MDASLSGAHTVPSHRSLQPSLACMLLLCTPANAHINMSVISSCAAYELPDVVCSLSGAAVQASAMWTFPARHRLTA
jgi:hypothetical protein